MSQARARPRSSPETEAYQGYLRGLRAVWKDDIYAQVVAGSGEVSEAYRLYAWLESRLQQFKYYGRWGLDRAVEAEMSNLAGALDAAARKRPECLRLNPTLDLPAYYREADFHQHRGGVWSSDKAAFVYEWAADRLSFSLQDSTAPYRRFAERVLAVAGAGRILDLGCGFGKSALPFAKLSPASRVVGVDLAAPCLRLAHLRALEEDVEAEWVQAAAEALPFPDGGFDAAVCYWLLHELPIAVQAETICEAARVLRPGGWFASFDMHTVPGGPLGAALHRGHGVRNQEPYLADLSLDRLLPVLKAAGFVDVRLEAAQPGRPAERDDDPLPPVRTHVNTILLARKAP